MVEIRDLIKEYQIKFPKNIDQNKTVVIIQDQTDMRMIIAHHLGKLGFKTVKQFSHGLEAIEWLRNTEASISFTICDHEMPVMNGFDFLQEVKADMRLRRGPFAITIDNPNREKIMLATENGVDGVLVKPFTLKDIVPKLKQAFQVYHNPNNPELLYEAAKIAFASGDTGKAKAIYEGLSKVTEKAARPIVGLACIAIKEKKDSEAEALFAQAKERNPAYVHTFVERGTYYASKGDVAKAVDEFKTAIELSPLNPVRYEKAAELLFELKRYPEAIELLNIALVKELNFPSLHHHLSQGYYKIKDYKKAIKHIRSALNQEPENVAYLNQLGVSLKEINMFDDALKAYNSVIKLEPDNRAALYNKAVLLKAKGSMPEAIKLLEKVVTKMPDFKEAASKLEEFRSAKPEDKAS